MNYYLLIGIITSIFIIGCSQRNTTETASTISNDIIFLEIPDTLVLKSNLKYQTSTSRWLLDNNLFSGYAVSYFEDTILSEKFGILEGKKQNEEIKYFKDGHVQHQAHYHEGKLQGTKKTWSSDSSHVLLSHLNYASGKVHGEQKKWYPSGELFKKLNLNMGKEEGLQQAFRKNGDLYANYEAKNGRIFGLKKAALCFGIEDENIQYEK